MLPLEGAQVYLKQFIVKKFNYQYSLVDLCQKVIIVFCLLSIARFEKHFFILFTECGNYQNKSTTPCVEIE